MKGNEDKEDLDMDFNISLDPANDDIGQANSDYTHESQYNNANNVVRKAATPRKEALTLINYQGNNIPLSIRGGNAADSSNQVVNNKTKDVYYTGHLLPTAAIRKTTQALKGNVGMDFEMNIDPANNLFNEADVGTTQRHRKQIANPLTEETTQVRKEALILTNYQGSNESLPIAELESKMQNFNKSPKNENDDRQDSAHSPTTSLIEKTSETLSKEGEDNDMLMHFELHDDSSANDLDRITEGSAYKKKYFEKVTKSPTLLRKEMMVLTNHKVDGEYLPVLGDNNIGRNSRNKVLVSNEKGTPVAKSDDEGDLDMEFEMTSEPDNNAIQKDSNRRGKKKTHADEKLTSEITYTGKDRHESEKEINQENSRKETTVLTNHKIKNASLPVYPAMSVFAVYSGNDGNQTQSSVGNKKRKHIRRYYIRSENDNEKNHFDTLSYFSGNRDLHLLSLAHPNHKAHPNNDINSLFTHGNGNNDTGQFRMNVDIVDSDDEFGGNIIASSPRTSMENSRSPMGSSHSDATALPIYPHPKSERGFIIRTSPPEKSVETATTQDIFPTTEQTFDKDNNEKSIILHNNITTATDEKSSTEQGFDKVNHEQSLTLHNNITSVLDDKSLIRVNDTTASAGNGIKDTTAVAENRTIDTPAVAENRTIDATAVAENRTIDATAVAENRTIDTTAVAENRTTDTTAATAAENGTKDKEVANITNIEDKFEGRGFQKSNISLESDNEVNSPDVNHASQEDVNASQEEFHKKEDMQKAEEELYKKQNMQQATNLDDIKLKIEDTVQTLDQLEGKTIGYEKVNSNSLAKKSNAEHMRSKVINEDSIMDTELDVTPSKKTDTDFFTLQFNDDDSDSVDEKPSVAPIKKESVVLKERVIANQGAAEHTQNEQADSNFFTLRFDDIENTDASKKSDTLHNNDLLKKSDRLHSTDISKKSNKLHDTDASKTPNKLHYTDASKTPDKLHSTYLTNTPDKLHNIEPTKTADTSLHITDTSKTLNTLHSSGATKTDDTLHITDPVKTSDRLHNTDVTKLHVTEAVKKSDKLKPVPQNSAVVLNDEGAGDVFSLQFDG